MFTDEEIKIGLVRLGDCPDLKYLKQVLAQTLLSIPAEGCEAGALLVSQGRRLLAQDLLQRLEGENPRHGGSTPNGNDIGDPGYVAAVTRRQSKPVALDAGKSRRRVEPLDDSAFNDHLGKRPRKG